MNLSDDDYEEEVKHEQGETFRKDIRINTTTKNLYDSPERARSPYSPQIRRESSKDYDTRVSSPLRGISKFIKSRRRDASPDSPSVRLDLLSGSVVAGLVATAINDVEASIPDVSKNKQLSDVIERAIKAEFKVNQLETQKEQIWKLITIAEEDANKEREKQKKLIFMLFTCILVDIIALSFAYFQQLGLLLQQYLGSIFTIHLSIFIGTVAVMKWYFEEIEDDDNNEEEDILGEDERKKDEITTKKEDNEAEEEEKSQIQEVALSEKENKSLNELKDTIALLPRDQKGLEWIKNCGDWMYLRYIHGHSFNIGKAFKYLVKTAEWREDFNTDSICQEIEDTASSSSLSLLKETFPIHFLGKDNDGHPVLLFRLAMCDFPGYLNHCKMEDLIKYSIYLQEKYLSTNKLILIIDLGYEIDDKKKPISTLGQARSFIAALLQYIGNLTKIFDPYYPNSYLNVYFVRCPITFGPVWRVAHLLIPQKTREKIIIVPGINPIEKLKQILSLKLIPDYLDGEANTKNGPKGGVIERNW